MGGTLQPINLKKDYKNRDILDYVRWNADQQAIENVANKLINSTEDGDSGADNISMTAIQSISTATSLQSFLEALAAMLISAQAAAKLGAVAPDTDISGTNIQAILNSIKAYIDTAIETLNANMNLMNNSLADDINERVKSADLAKTDGTGGSSIVGSQSIIGVQGNTVYQQLLGLKQLIDDIEAGVLPDGYIDNTKLADDIKIGSLAALATVVKTSVVNALNEIVGNIGDLSALSTADKTKIVNALNEVLGNVGDKANLTTTNKTSLVGAVNEIKSTLETHKSENVHKLKLGIEAVNNDLNQCLTDGIYAFSPSTLNRPIDGYGIVEVFVSAGVTYNNTYNWIWQRAYYTNDPKHVWVRQKINNSAWTAWFDLFQYANDGKTGIANAVTAKGVAASPTDTFAALAGKIGQIAQFRKATGQISANNGTIIVTGLAFRPKYVIMFNRYVVIILSDTSEIIGSNFVQIANAPVDFVNVDILGSGYGTMFGTDEDIDSYAAFFWEPITANTITDDGFSGWYHVAGAKWPSTQPLKWIAIG